MKKTYSKSVKIVLLSTLFAFSIVAQGQTREFVQRTNNFNSIDVGDHSRPTFTDIDGDWILMDIKMQKMNGLIAAQRIKRINPKLNIAFVTNYDDKVYRTAAKSIGVYLFFMKNNLLTIRSKLEENEVVA
ncbi:MAG: response regulator [Melioribacteraceae bacterium]|nr:response regulator [Melioribacteraceae bacterium]